MIVTQRLNYDVERGCFAQIYLDSFYKGVMVVGEHKGKKVQDAKPEIRALMISRGEAAAYAEPVRRSL